MLNFKIMENSTINFSKHLFAEMFVKKEGTKGSYYKVDNSDNILPIRIDIELLPLLKQKDGSIMKISSRFTKSEIFADDKSPLCEHEPYRINSKVYLEQEENLYIAAFGHSDQDGEITKDVFNHRTVIWFKGLNTFVLFHIDDKLHFAKYFDTIREYIQRLEDGENETNIVEDVIKNREGERWQAK